MQQQSYTDLELEEPVGWQGSPANNSPSKLHGMIIGIIGIIERIAFAAGSAIPACV